MMDHVAVHDTQDGAHTNFGQRYGERPAGRLACMIRGSCIFGTCARWMGPHILRTSALTCTHRRTATARRAQPPAHYPSLFDQQAGPSGKKSGLPDVAHHWRNGHRPPSHLFHGRAPVLGAPGCSLGASVLASSAVLGGGTSVHCRGPVCFTSCLLRIADRLTPRE